MKVEGRNAVYELMKTDKEIDKILVQKDLKDDASKRLINVIRSHKIKLQMVDKYVIEKESVSKRHQGFIAFVSDYKYFDIEDVINDCDGKENALVVILNEIFDPHNLGSIISKFDKVKEHDKDWYNKVARQYKKLCREYDLNGGRK